MSAAETVAGAMPETVADSDRWYVAQLKPNGFAKAEANLHRQSFETFMPVREVSVRHARQMREVRKPIFPGYIFVKFGAERADWRKINSTLGVARLVCTEKMTPSPVPEALMAGLKARCDMRHVLQPLDDLAIGERVKMVSGSFAEFIGEIETFVGDDCVRLLFEFMGQATRVDVPRGGLERV